MMKQDVSNIRITECVCCGTCCKKGGPGFHHEDRHLIERGIILTTHLYTIRKGEQVYDNVRECHMPATSDIIKIKGQKPLWTCVFFDEKQKHCQIYENRPMECQVLKCWDTRDIERIYAENRLTRKDVLGNIKGLWDLIEDHHSRCDYERIRDLLEKSEKGAADTGKAFGEMLRYDAHIRSLVVEKSGIDPEMTDFLFGRPLSETVKWEVRSGKWEVRSGKREVGKWSGAEERSGTDFLQKS